MVWLDSYRLRRMNFRSKNKTWSRRSKRWKDRLHRRWKVWKSKWARKSLSWTRSSDWKRRSWTKSSDWKKRRMNASWGSWTSSSTRRGSRSRWRPSCKNSNKNFMKSSKTWRWLERSRVICQSSWQNVFKKSEMLLKRRKRLRRNQISTAGKETRRRIGLRRTTRELRACTRRWMSLTRKSRASSPILRRASVKWIRIRRPWLFTSHKSTRSTRGSAAWMLLMKLSGWRKWKKVPSEIYSKGWPTHSNRRRTNSRASSVLSCFKTQYRWFLVAMRAAKTACPRRISAPSATWKSTSRWSRLCWLTSPTSMSITKIRWERLKMKRSGNRRSRTLIFDQTSESAETMERSSKS